MRMTDLSLLGQSNDFQRGSQCTVQMALGCCLLFPRQTLQA